MALRRCSQAGVERDGFRAASCHSMITRLVHLQKSWPRETQRASPSRNLTRRSRLSHGLVAPPRPPEMPRISSAAAYKLSIHGRHEPRFRASRQAREAGRRAGSDYVSTPRERSASSITAISSSRVRFRRSAEPEPADSSSAALSSAALSSATTGRPGSMRLWDFTP